VIIVAEGLVVLSRMIVFPNKVD